MVAWIVRVSCDWGSCREKHYGRRDHRIADPACLWPKEYGRAESADAAAEEEKAAEEAQRKLDEKAYKDSLSRIPERDQKYPWGNVRR